jgi:hypothetical protein
MATFEESVDKAIEVAVERAVAKAVSQALLQAHPIGSIYLTLTDSNPSSLFGGTWEKVGSGKCLWLADSSHGAGTTISAGLPNITGSSILSWGDASGGGVIMQSGSGYSGALYPARDTSRSNFYTKATNTTTASNHLNALKIDASKSNSIYGSSDTVQPPAYVVIAWKRTA